MIVLTPVLTRLKDRFFSKADFSLFSIMLVWNEKWMVGEKMGSKPRSCCFMIMLTTVLTQIFSNGDCSLFSIMLVWNEKWKFGEKWVPNHDPAVSKFVL